MMLQQQYKDLCCGLPFLPILGEENPFEKIIKDLAKSVYDGKQNGQQIPQDLYFKTADNLLKAIHTGMGGTSFSFDDPRNNLLAHFQNNTFQFSAAKSQAQVIHINSLLIDATGNLKNFTTFRNDVIKAGYEFNVNWLKTEYNTAQAGAQMAHLWQSLKENDYITYSTVGDDRVRPAHVVLDGFTAPPTDKIWNTIFPPNDWNCRCTVIPGLKDDVNKYKLEPETVKSLKVPTYFQRNVGNTKTLLDADGYLKYQTAIDKPRPSEPKKLQAVKNYGMQTAEELYKKYEFDKSAAFKTTKEAFAWFDGIAKDGVIKLKDETGYTTNFKREYVRHAMEDHGTEKRMDYIGNFIKVFKEPDEIWSNVNSATSSLERYYIKYYKDFPLMIIVDVDNANNPYSFVEISKLIKAKKVLNETQLTNKRMGQLLYRK